MVSRALSAMSSHQPRDLQHVFLRHAHSVYRFHYTRVGNREDAEDLTAEVFLKATRKLDGNRGDASVASRLFAVSRTVLADHWRRYYRDPPPRELDDAMMAVGLSDGSAEKPSQTSEQLVGAALEALPARYRRVLELRFLEGCSVDEAAREMGVTAGNLKVLQHRAPAKAAETGLPSWHADGDTRLSRLMLG